MKRHAIDDPADAAIRRPFCQLTSRGVGVG